MSMDEGDDFLLQLLQPFFQRYAKTYLAGLGLLVIVDLLEVQIPRQIGQVIDGVNQGTGLYWHPLSYIAMIAVTLFILRYFYRNLLLGATRKLEFELRSQVYSHALRLPLSVYDAQGPGSMMALIINDITAVRLVLGLGSILFIDAVVMGFVSFFSMVQIINFELAFWSLIPLPVILIVAAFMGKRVHRYFKNVQESFSRLTEFSQEAFGGAKVIKGYAVENKIIDRFLARNQENWQANLALVKVQAAYVPITHVLPFVCYAIALWLGGKMIMSNTITIGDLAAFIGYQGMIIWPVMGLGFLINMVQRGLASLGRLYSFMEKEAQDEAAVFEEDKSHFYNAEAPSVSIRHLTFAYASSSAPVLEDVSVTIPAGSVVGIVGRTGAGKSTLLKLLLRLYDVPSKRIYLNDQDIVELSVLELRQQMGYVPQDTSLFSKTIGENIALYGNFGDERIRSAAALASVTEDIHLKPEGFDTALGEKGRKLSGGQRQRVAIARALVREPKLLLLDDVFSALDYSTQARLLQQFTTFCQGRTVIIVSQRVAAVAHADIVLVMDQGKIVESGTHEELRKKQGLYFDLYRQQLVEEEGETYESV